MKLTLLFGAFAAALAAVFVAFFHIGPALPFVIAVALCTYCLFPFKRSRPGLAIATIVVLVIGPGYAFAASIEIGQALNGSLQEVINAVVTAAIAALVGWVLMVVKAKFNVDIEAQNRAALTAFLQRQASSLIAMGAVKLNGIKVEVQNQALADAANMALAAIPDALKFFGLTPASLQQRIIDLLPKEPAVAQAQAVALDVANPATPSKAA